MTIKYTGPEGWGDTAYPGDAGIDLPIVGEHILVAGERKDIPTGLRIELPEGHYGRITGRSSALRKRGIRVYEGIIDAGFRGELFSYVENVSLIATVLTDKDRVAQLIVQPVINLPIVRVNTLSDSQRGTKGFGSSDKKETIDLLGSEWRERDAPVVDPPRIYLGGPIDYTDHGARNEYIRRLKVDIRRAATYFDPLTENTGEPDPGAIWNKNMKALNWCDIAVFLFPDPTSYGFGSPIEIATAAAKGKRVVVWHNSEHVGVYLRKLWGDGVIVATEWIDFIRVMGEELSAVNDG